MDREVLPDWKLAAVAGIGLGYWLRRRGRPMELKGASVVVTGGSRGLGLLLAEEFAARGARVAICARDEDELEDAEERLRAQGAEVLALPCDVRDAEQVEAFIAAVTDGFGGVDVLVNNAGVIQVGPVESMRLHDFERAMEVMYSGPVHAIRAVLPQMMNRRRGRIVNVTSIGGKVAIPHLVPYGAAKFALVGLSEGLRAELRRHGILVTTVVPGLMRTGSPVQALFKGDAAEEFTWFSLASATPLTTTSARRAARRIVAAARGGEAEVTLTWQAKLLRLANGVAPGLMSDALGLVNRLLPDGTDPRERRGMELATPLAPSPVTRLMNRAAIRNQEFAGRHRPSPRHARQVGLDSARSVH